MPAQQEAHKGPGRRTRRPAKKDASTKTPTINGKPPVVSINGQGDSFQPTQILQRGDPETSIPQSLTPTSDPTILSPPSNPPNLIGGIKDTQSGTDSAPDSSKRRKNKNKVSRTELTSTPPKHPQRNTTRIADQKTTDTTRPTTRTGNTTRIADQRATDTTRPTTRTPSKAYAGPTFHNSPAASSLPLPTFLSKSVPNVNKTTSLKNLLDHDSLESTSESEGSPFQDAATPSKIQHAHEESPLDIFFQADQKAKAKQVLPNSKNTDNSIEGYFPNSFGSLLTPQPAPRPTRNHVRHHTDSSTTGMFPLEMEPGPKQLANGFHDFEPGEHDAAPLSKGLTEEQRQAQSLALMKLLNWPETQGRVQQDSNNRSPLTSTVSPSPRLNAGNRSSPRLSGNPPEYPNGLESKTPEQRRATLLALAEKQIAMPNIQSTQRPPSSGLRKEVRMPNSPASSQTLDLPSTSTPTPTPSRTIDKKGNVVNGQSPSRPNGHNLRYPTPAAGNTNPPFINSGRGNDTSLKLMEDDLRRILKLS